MKIAIPNERAAGETRVAATPATVGQLVALGFDVAVETGAGAAAQFADAAWQEAGAEIVDSAGVYDADIICRVNAPEEQEIEKMKEKTILISFLQPAQNPELVSTLAEKKITVLAMDMVPRISRAQSLDALSSMANISGYRAVVEAAHAYGRFFAGQITAAGKVAPAEVLVIGAGVAGLAAIAAAGSLGAVVKAFDTRLEVGEQIESMGGQFLKLEFADEAGGSDDGYAKVMSKEFIAAEMALFREQAETVDIIITTAAVPGKRSPVLITKEMVDSMKPGSVIVDLAAPGGGNCEYTEPGEVVTVGNGVKVIGYTDLANRLAGQSSQLYGTNIVNLIKLLAPEKDGRAVVDFDDVILRNMTVTHDGETLFPPPQIKVSAAPQAPPAADVQSSAPEEKKPLHPARKFAAAGCAAALFLLLGASAPAPFLNHLIVFVLACVLGFYVVWSVTHSLHTPLMSVTNAVSGIIIVGALLQVAQGNSIVSVSALIAVFIASINIFGGFYVTRRMLKMFRKG